MRLPFLGGSRTHRSIAINAQKTINWHLENGGPDAQNRISLLPRAGLVLDSVVGLGPHRGSIEHDGNLFVVSGREVYQIDDTGTATLRGTINTSLGNVSMASNGTELIIVDGTDGWIWDGAFTQIADADFVDAEQVVFIDGYFIVNKPGTGEFYISDLYDGTAWAALDFATAEVDPDDLLAINTVNRELWLFGKYTTEIYYNSGNADFPFERSSGGFIEWGIAAPWSQAKADNSMFWLSRNKYGQGFVVRATGFQPQIISHDGLHSEFESYSNIDDAIGFAYQQAGHTLYVLSFPSEGKTHVYDASISDPHYAWTTWDYYPDSRFRGHTHCFFSGQHYVGDYENGSLYTMDLDSYTDNANTIRRVRQTQFTHKEGKRIRWNSLQVKFEHGVGLVGTGQGSNPQAMLRWSDDDGKTWSNEHLADIGAIGEYGTRAKWNRLGVSRNRTYELAVSDPVKAVVIDAYADVEVLDN